MLGLLHKEAVKGGVHGIKVARKAPVITHLLFADDSLLFARAHEVEASRIMEILQEYQVASGASG